MKLITKQPNFLPVSIGDDLIASALFQFETLNKFYYSASSSLSFVHFSKLLLLEVNYFIDKFHSNAHLFNSDQYKSYLQDLTDLSTSAHDSDFLTETLPCHNVDLQLINSYPLDLELAELDRYLTDFDILTLYKNGVSTLFQLFQKPKQQLSSFNDFNNSDVERVYKSLHKIQSVFESEGFLMPSIQ